ncbi:MAG: glycoside hydrolase family 18 protein [Fibrella sp.]|nr:glycoside hydrolase family 18 protein [Armatimonadota bacterium]
MKRSFKASIALAFVVSLATITIQQAAFSAPWVTAYYPSWTLTNPTPANLDLRAITHLVFFALTPNADGTLSDPGGTIVTNAPAVKTAVRNAGKKVLICIGGGGTITPFRGAISPASRAAFVQNIVTWVTTNGYDGVDIDMEPLESSDAANYQAFITALRTALNAQDPNLLLTAAVEWNPVSDTAGNQSLFYPIRNSFNQINVMTYDMSGNWPGWCTWYNAPLFQGGNFLPSTGAPMPSGDRSVQAYRTAGIPASKLSLGAAFYGSKWTNVTGPMQAIPAGTTVENLTYDDIMTNYYSAGAYRWDSAAQSSYLTRPANPPYTYISYDDPTLLTQKVNYVDNQGLGGLVCWNIGQQYRAAQPVGEQNPLLDAIYDALNPVVTRDPLNDWSYVSSKSVNWMIDGTNPTFFNGDTKRATRSANTTEYLVYSYPKISKFDAKVYTLTSAISSVQFFASTDNGTTYTAVPVTTGARTASSNGWGYYTLKNTNILPANTTNLKVQLTPTPNGWDPQLSLINISHQ